jgi:hypothetical protein
LTFASRVSHPNLAVRRQAFFFYADASEQRVTPVLRAAGASAADGPVVVLVSLFGAFRPRKLAGSAITAAALADLVASATLTSVTDEL